MTGMLQAQTRDGLTGFARKRVDPRDTEAVGRLTTLAEAMDDAVEAVKWATVDLFAAFAAVAPRPQTQPRRILHGVVVCAEWLRNVLILAPVLFTWYGIWQAADAYAKTADRSEPFLYLWQRGFDGQYTGPTLSEVALWDVFLIGMVLALTLIAFVGAGILDRDSEREVAAFRRDLAALLTDASLCLAPYRASPAGALSAELPVLLHQLGTLTATLTSGAQTLTQAAGGLRQAADHVLGMVSEVGGAIRGVAEEMRALHGAVGDSTSASRELAGTQRESAQAARDAASSIGQSAGLLVQLAGRVEQGLGTVADGSREMARVTQDVGAAQGALLSALAAERGAQANLAKGLGDALFAVGPSLKEIQDYTRTLHTVAVDVLQMAHQFPATTAALRDGFQHLLWAQHDGATRLAAATNHIEYGARAIHDQSVAVRDVLSRIAHDLDRLGAMPEGAATSA